MKKSKPVVVDTSVLVKWLNQKDELYLPQADKIFQDAREQKIEVLAPELSKYESGNAILYKGMSLPESKASLTTLYAIPIKFVPLDEEVALDAMEIAHEAKITYYDASFVSLAKKIGATLVTDNPKHQKLSAPEIPIVSLKNWPMD